jgi:large subunit ribosomal protein L30
MSEKRKCLAVIRIRGIPTASPDVRKTLEMLHLCRVSHATLVNDKPAYIGMLRKAQQFLAWGEVSEDNIKLLLKERGKLIGGKELTDGYAQKIGYKTLDELAEALYNTEVEYKNLQDMKPVFRLHPPSKGYKGTVKKSYKMGGASGPCGEAINDLIKRMI